MRRWITSGISLILMSVLCLGLLAGCASPEDVIAEIENEISMYDRSERDWMKLAKAYGKLGDEAGARSTLIQALDRYSDSKDLQKLLETYLLPAPAPNKESGNYEGALRLNFSGEDYERGQLYVTVDRDESPQALFEALSRGEPEAKRGVTIRNYPSEHPFSVDLCEPGEHTVRAFIAEDEAVQSKVFEGTYTLSGTDFSEFDFDLSSGEYKAPATLSFIGAEGLTIGYTLDGSDPLFLSVSGANLSNGTELTGDTLPLTTGTTTINARAMDKNGLISPLRTATYTVTMVFDAASSNVGEDGSYDYIGTTADGLLCYDKNGKEGALKFQTLLERKVASFALFTLAYQGEIPEGAMSAMSGAAAAALETPRTYIYVRLNTGDIWRGEMNNGTAQNWTTLSNWDDLRQVGPGWLIYPIETTGQWDYYSTGTQKYYKKSANWIPNSTPIGTEELAKMAALLTKDIAIYITESRNVKACNPDGSNERLLWTNEEGIILDAVAENLILYRSGGKHMVYDMNTGSHRANTVVPADAVLLGYTSSAVYIKPADKGGVTRIAMDYAAL